MRIDDVAARLSWLLPFMAFLESSLSFFVCPEVNLRRFSSQSEQWETFGFRVLLHPIVLHIVVFPFDLGQGSFLVLEIVLQLAVFSFLWGIVAVFPFLEQGGGLEAGIFSWVYDQLELHGTGSQRCVGYSHKPHLYCYEEFYLFQKREFTFRVDQNPQSCTLQVNNIRNKKYLYFAKLLVNYYRMEHYRRTTTVENSY